MKADPVTPQGWLMLIGLWGGMLLAGWLLVTVLKSMSVGVAALIGVCVIAIALDRLKRG